MAERITDDDGDLVLPEDTLTDVEAADAWLQLLDAATDGTADIFDVVQSLDLQNAVLFFEALDTVVTRLKDLHRDVALDVGQRLDAEHIPQLLSTTFTMTGGGYREWDPDLVRLARRRLADTITAPTPEGERVMDREQFTDAWDTIGQLFTLTPANMKPQALRRLGLEPTEFAHYRPPRPTAKVLR